MKKCILLLTILLSFTTLAETYTQAREISEIELKQYSNMTYFNVYSSAGSWGAVGCAQQSVVTFKSTETIGYEQFLSMVLAAKMANKKVSFNVTCTDSTSLKGINIKIW